MRRSTLKFRDPIVEKIYDDDGNWIGSLRDEGKGIYAKWGGYKFTGTNEEMREWIYAREMESREKVASGYYQDSRNWPVKITSEHEGRM